MIEQDTTSGGADETAATGGAQASGADTGGEKQAPAQKAASQKAASQKAASQKAASQQASGSKAASKKRSAQASSAKARQPQSSQGDAGAGKRIKVTQVRSANKAMDWQKACLRGLGLRKMHHSRELEDTPSVRGMATKIPHLVRLEEVR